MKLRVKAFNIRTESPLVVLLHRTDAIRQDIHVYDRVELTYKGRKAIAVVDVLDHHKNPARCIALEHGEVGLFAETSEALRVPEGAHVELHLAKKPESLKYIKEKVAGKVLTQAHIKKIVEDIANGALTDIELTHFVTAVEIRGFDFSEIGHMTKAVAATGEQFKSKKYPIIDKHCIGGVPGNRTTMIVIPILAAFGLTMPKTSSRAITSPAGTADTMEILCDVSLPLKKMTKVVAKTNACIAWGGAMKLAPADDRIIRVEKPLSVDATGLMLSSVMAKKAVVNATHVIIDIPFGKGAKIETRKEAEVIKGQFITIGKLLGMKIIVTLTDGRQPIGNGIGPTLEAIDVLKVLECKEDAPKDLREKSILLAGLLLEFVGSVRKGNGDMVARGILDSGDAYKKMQEIRKAQGIKELLPLPEHTHICKADKNGTIAEISNKTITKVCRYAGAPVTKNAGMYLHHKVGDQVRKGDALFTVYAGSKDKKSQVIAYLKRENPYIISQKSKKK